MAKPIGKTKRLGLTYFKDSLIAHGVRPRPRSKPRLAKVILAVETDPKDLALVAPALPIPNHARPFTGFNVERVAYARAKPRLLREMPGQFVVFVGEEMVGPFEDRSTALRAAWQRFGYGSVYSKQVLAEEPIAETGSSS